jgi:hypothetical protein
MQKEASWGAEFAAVAQLLTTKRYLLLLPAFFISYFYNGFMSTWLTSYFVRRALERGRRRRGLVTDLYRLSGPEHFRPFSLTFPGSSVLSSLGELPLLDE